MHKMILAGYGGQGMLLCGQVLAYAAMKDGFHVTWLPSYGPEMRGGAASCSVVVSKKPVGSPVIRYADVVVAMSQPAFDKYHESVTEGGSLIYSSELVAVSEKREGIRYIGMDYSELAMGLGNPKVFNMIVLGSLNELIQCVSDSSLREALRYKFGEKEKLVALNEKAIELGKRRLLAYPK